MIKKNFSVKDITPFLSSHIILLRMPPWVLKVVHYNGFITCVWFCGWIVILLILNWFFVFLDTNIKKLLNLFLNKKYTDKYVIQTICTVEYNVNVVKGF